MGASNRTKDKKYVARVFRVPLVGLTSETARRLGENVVVHAHHIPILGRMFKHKRDCLNETKGRKIKDKRSRATR